MTMPSTGRDMSALILPGRIIAAAGRRYPVEAVLQIGMAVLLVWGAARAQWLTAPEGLAPYFTTVVIGLAAAMFWPFWLRGLAVLDSDRIGLIPFRPRDWAIVAVVWTNPMRFAATIAVGCAAALGAVRARGGIESLAVAATVLAWTAGIVTWQPRLDRFLQRFSLLNHAGLVAGVLAAVILANPGAIEASAGVLASAVAFPVPESVIRISAALSLLGALVVVAGSAHVPGWPIAGSRHAGRSAPHVSWSGRLLATVPVSAILRKELALLIRFRSLRFTVYASLAVGVVAVMWRVPWAALVFVLAWSSFLFNLFGPDLEFEGVTRYVLVPGLQERILRMRHAVTVGAVGATAAGGIVLALPLALVYRSGVLTSTTEFLAVSVYVESLILAVTLIGDRYSRWFPTPVARDEPRYDVGSELWALLLWMVIGVVAAAVVLAAISLMRAAQAVSGGAVALLSHAAGSLWLALGLATAAQAVVYGVVRQRAGAE